MLIVDLSQIATAQLMVQTQAWKSHGRVEMNVDLIRHMILNSLLMINKYHKNQYGRMTLACDTGRSWRKFAFPYYKHKRGSDREKFKIDWKKFFAFLDEITNEIKQHFPYIVVGVNHAEGDDVIGAIVRHVQQNNMMEEILIVSGDKDFKQLHNDRTRQFSPILRKFIGTTDPVLELKEHIIKGDRNDGVPNILSGDDCFAVGTKQSKMTAGRLAAFLEAAPESYAPTPFRNWKRNELMIDLAKTPDKMRSDIIASYENQIANPNRNGVFNYLIKHRLKELQAHTEEF